MSNYGSRIPLHWQNPEIRKAEARPSMETFRPNITHESKYQKFGPEHSTISQEYRVRRYPNGLLDLQWTANQIVDAIHKLEYNGTTGSPNTGSASLLPVEAALLTVVFPQKYRETEPQQAEILTQLSDSEKMQLRAFIEKQMADEASWNAGFGGATVPGSRVRNVGG